MSEKKPPKSVVKEGFDDEMVVVEESEMEADDNLELVDMKGQSIMASMSRKEVTKSTTLMDASTLGYSAGAASIESFSKKSANVPATYEVEGNALTVAEEMPEFPGG
ncbi:MAG TPA: hypothetical protein EYO58_12720, partial [Flavobacteriales bacterium]|nr:hypothetical protein [Flavobacteriales bacterium]